MQTIDESIRRCGHEEAHNAVFTHACCEITTPGDSMVSSLAALDIHTICGDCLTGLPHPRSRCAIKEQGRNRM